MGREGSKAARQMFCISDGCRGSGGCIVIAWSVGVSLPRRLGMIYLECWVETVSLYSVRSRSIVFGYNLKGPKNRFESFISCIELGRIRGRRNKPIY
jgi:hypothetical protein